MNDNTESRHEAGVPRPLDPRGQAEVMATWQYTEPPLLSILCATYNHEYYISDAINGFLGQITSVPFEIIIRDDASTDRTRDIVKEYKDVNQQIIKTIYYDNNQYIKGKKPFPDMLSKASGKYFALCEGDDYWFDNRKLQKQIDYLETNQDVAMVFHRVLRLKDDEIVEAPEWPEIYSSKFGFEIMSMLQFSTPPTSSIVARRMKIDHLLFKSPYGDRNIAVTASLNGRLHGDSKARSVYRIHSTGVKSGSSAAKQKCDDAVSRFFICKRFPVSQNALKYHQRRLRTNAKSIIRSACRNYSDIRIPMYIVVILFRYFGLSVLRFKTTLFHFFHK